MRSTRVWFPVCLSIIAVSVAQGQMDRTLGDFANRIATEASDTLLLTPQIAAGPLDDQRGFTILVWQFQTDVQRDEALYRQLNLHAWHVDYGADAAGAVAWSKRVGWPYYVDHAAGKGILHLTPSSGLNQIPRDGTPAGRPWSFVAEETLAELKKRLDLNLQVADEGPVLAIAMDDEVSLGTFNTPLEVDFSKESIFVFRKWLERQYRSETQFRAAWPETNRFGEADPGTYESIRWQVMTQPPSQWRLAKWIDFRAYMDTCQAAVFAELVRHANGIAPSVPAGIVGGQQPSAYGGFDYAKLRHTLQWTEAYDIGGSNELLRSFWASAPRRGRMQTFFASGDAARDRWFLWYYLAHGCRGVIAWPESGGQPWFDSGEVHPQIKALAETFADVQAAPAGVLSHPETEPLFSSIAILHSHPSVQVGWAVDATAHGKTWPRRSSSLDNQCLSSGQSRIAWTRLLEDLGHQARFMDTAELVDGRWKQWNVQAIVLPQTFALSRTECAAVEAFVNGGGTVIADYGTAITDEHGTGYERSPLDALFGIDRSRDVGWFDGQRRFEVNGEQYQDPLRKRLSSEGCFVVPNTRLVICERGLRQSFFKHPYGSGTAYFLNLSPTGYADSELRAGAYGENWRKGISSILESAGVIEPVRIKQVSGRQYGVELLRYQTAIGDEIWAIVTNPVRDTAIDGPGKIAELDEGTIGIELACDRKLRQLTNLRDGDDIDPDSTLQLELNPTEAILLRVKYSGVEPR